MFTKLEITNFKSIGHAEFDLGKINVLTGHSNLGKSNVVNAIHCLVHNCWDSSYLKWGQKKCSVRLTDDTGEWVEYQHDQSSASYLLSTNPQPFTKIGKTVPNEVSDFLKMNYVQFDEDLKLDFNFERQFDPAFIISLSGFELAKVFGKLMNLDIVMTASRNISKDVLAYNKKKDNLSAIQDACIEYIKSGYAIELKYALLHLATETDAHVSEMDNQCKQLGSLIADLEFYSACASVYSDLLSSQNMQLVDEIHEPEAGLKDILAGLEIALAQQTAFIEQLSAPIPQFDFEANARLTQALVELTHFIERQTRYSNVIEHSTSVDFNSVNSIDQLKTVLSSIEMELGQSQSNLNLLSQQDALIETKKTEFQNYLTENNLCPITHSPFATGCVDRILSAV